MNYAGAIQKISGPFGVALPGPAVTIKAPPSFALGKPISFAITAKETTKKPVPPAHITYHASLVSPTAGTTDVLPAAAGSKAKFTIPSSAVPIDEPLQFSVNVTGADGGMTSSVASVAPRLRTISTRANIKGLPAPAPDTFTAVAGSQITLTTDATLTLGGFTYTFLKYAGVANGSSSTSTIVVPDASRPIIATYRKSKLIG